MLPPAAREDNQRAENLRPRPFQESNVDAHWGGQGPHGEQFVPNLEHVLWAARGAAGFDAATGAAASWTKRFAAVGTISDAAHAPPPAAWPRGVRDLVLR
jgi:hypothetical protein